MPVETQIVNDKSVMRIALVIAFIQFTNALEYMAFTPVFTFMTDALSVPVSFAGYASGIYTLGAVISGVAAFYWVERFNKKRFIFRNMLLLGIFTLPRDAVSSGIKAKLFFDSQTLLFASSTALVQFSPMLIIPILTPLLIQFMGAQ